MKRLASNKFDNLKSNSVFVHKLLVVAELKCPCAKSYQLTNSSLGQTTAATILRYCTLPYAMVTCECFFSLRDTNQVFASLLWWNVFSCYIYSEVVSEPQRVGHDFVIASENCPSKYFWTEYTIVHHVHMNVVSYQCHLTRIPT